MSTIVLRSVKNAPLTNAEVDANFSNLNTDKTELGGTYSSGTANGVLYLSSSKVLTTGSALTFDGTNLGVGTSSPGAKLEIAGNSATTGPSLRLSNLADVINAGGVLGTVEFYTGDDSGGGDSVVSSIQAIAENTTPASTSSLLFKTGTNTERLRITSAGNVGIGTSSPLALLHLQSASAPTLRFSQTATSTAYGNIYTDANGTININADAGNAGAGETIFRVFVDNTERMRINSSGNVGIGNTNPTEKLTVTGNAAISGTITEAGSPVVVQTDIGTAPNEIPLNQYLGNLAYQDAANIAGQVGVQAGTAAAPAITTTGDTNTGIFFPAADTIAFAEGGAEAMRINSSGQVGIGTSSPLYALDVRSAGTASISLETTSGPAAIRVSSLASGTAGVTLTSSAGTQSILGGLGSVNNMVFNVNSTERMRIDASGNLGLGTTSPNGRIHVSGSANQTLRLTTSGGGAPQIVLETTGLGAQSIIANVGSVQNITFNVNGSERARIDSSGNLGIGTTSPGARLHLGGQTASAKQAILATAPSNLNFRLEAVNGDTGTAGGTLQAKFGLRHDDGSTNVDTAAFRFFRGSSASDGAIGFATNDTERMRLDSSGNLGIGTSSPSASAILDAQSTTKGVRMPNMTTTQKNAIASPAAGLMVFDTTLAKLCVYSGAAWETITSL
jgi:hypothetical protein